jgi:ribulose-bisphosphate carboxylase small chain
MRIKQGTFSTLPDLTDDEIKAQIQYIIDQKWAVSVEYTDDPHPRNVYWEMFGLPMFDTTDASAAFGEIQNARKSFPNHYIKVSGYNARYTKQTTGLSFIVNRPKTEPGFRLDRTELNDRHIAYTLHSYAADTAPHGTRYQDNGNGKGPEPD